MAIADPYVNAPEYRDGINQDDTSEDTEIDIFLAAMSRIVEKKTGRVFNKVGSAIVRNIDARGGRRLWLPDFATVTGLVVKVDSTGDFTYDKTLTITTDFFVGPNDALTATLTPEELPGRFLELNPNGTVVGAWPDRFRSVEVTADWGWPVVPDAIKKGVIALTKQVRDATQQPFTLTLESLESQIQMAPGASAVIKDLIRHYGKGVVGF